MLKGKNDQNKLNGHVYFYTYAGMKHLLLKKSFFSFGAKKNIKTIKDRKIFLNKNRMVLEYFTMNSIFFKKL